MSKKISIRGKTILVTGAGSGIGAASARALHAAGGNVVLVDLNIGPVKGLATSLGDKTLALAADVTDRARMDEVVAQTVERFGRLDIVFANAGIATDPPATIRGVDEATFERVIEVDLLSVWRTVRAALPQIVANRGHVLVTASTYAYFNGVGNAPYAMSKAGVEMFGRSLRAELAGTGATAGVLYPGWVATPIAHSAQGGHPIASELVKLGFPGPYRKPITPERIAGEIVTGLENRAPRVTCPGWWTPVSIGRGAVNPVVDWIIDRHRRVHTLVSRLDTPADHDDDTVSMIRP